MTLEQKTKLEKRIRKDLEKLGLPLDFKLDVRGYSKTYNGRYNPNNDTVVLYSLRKNGELREYDVLLKIVIHEVIHHYQWKHTDYKRVKGIMHNEEFKRLEQYYLDKAEELGLIDPIFRR
ncbi:MAG: hypothetical protein H0Z24_05745 [Thermosipho sp. (in: Bacteria)]|nr:hypothetical protein [Thermosipho sp. (in: thermotogales)]